MNSVARSVCRISRQRCLHTAAANRIVFAVSRNNAHRRVEARTFSVHSNTSRHLSTDSHAAASQESKDTPDEDLVTSELKSEIVQAEEPIKENSIEHDVLQTNHAATAQRDLRASSAQAGIPEDNLPSILADENTKPIAMTEDMLPEWKDYSDRVDPSMLEVMRTIFKYKHVTKVQKTILDMMPIQNDLLIRSKTGTGKTLAFLVPAQQRAFEHWKRKGLSGPALKEYANKNAATLIISPTRELATQIATEARRLVTLPGSNMKALCLIGGDGKREQLKLMRRERNDFVVASPGRLLDMLENEPDFASLMPNLQTLILDEADTLLELGFRKELELILQFLPKTRQTYMFSATVSKDVRRIARSYLSKDHTYLNLVSKDDQDSHALIKQEYILRPIADHLKTVLSLIISQQLENPTSKIMVFLQTTRMTLLYASVFKTLRRLYPNPAFQQFDIHAQRTQDSRSKISKAFRTAGAGSVLFTTDVSARGVDYPDVSLVIQAGSPSSRDLYIHRTGRTGRAGKTGRSILILGDSERGFLDTLGRDLVITEKHFPDSEIALGTAQQKVFGLTKKLLHPSLLQDTFDSSCGALLPRAREFGVTSQEITNELTEWFLSLSHDGAAAPIVQDRYLRGGRSGGGRGGDNGRARSDGFAGSSRQGGDRYNSQRAHKYPVTREYRPIRPSEISGKPKPKHDYSRFAEAGHGVHGDYADTLRQFDRKRVSSWGGRGRTRNMN